MNRQDVINNIMANYRQFGVTPAAIEENIRSGEAQGFSCNTIYTGLRLALGSVFGTDEYFSVEEMSEALGATEEEIVQQIESVRNDIATAGLNPDDYAREIRLEETRRFVLLPGDLK